MDIDASRISMITILGAFGLLTIAPPSTGLAAQQPTAEAIGVSVQTATVDETEARAVLTSDDGMEEASAGSATVADLVSAENVFSIASGGGDATEVSAEGVTTLENVRILDGAVTADQVAAVASSSNDGDGATSVARGASFRNLRVDGQSIGPDVPPDTRIDVPGVGTVVLNERVRDGGDAASSMTLNMIHVILRDELTGTRTGDIVVGSVRTSVP